MGSPVREGDQAFRDNGGVDCRGVDPRKDARVADPSLRTRADGEERTACMSVVPAGLGSVQWPQ